MVDVDTPYVCTLTEESAKKAKEELGEDPKERLGAVAALREWVEREPWIQAPTDTRFLLAFLRCEKFCQLRARERLSTFLHLLHVVFPHVIGTDPGDEKHLSIIRKARVFALPDGTDQQGRKLIMIRLDFLDTSGTSYSYNEMTSAAISVFLSMMIFDENVQVNGAMFLADARAMVLQMVSFMGKDEQKKQVAFRTKGMPLRIKRIHICNTGPVFEAFMTVLKTLMPQKIQKRVRMHGQGLTSVYKEVPMSLLPSDYLPDDYTGQTVGTFEDVIEKNIQDYILEPKCRAYLKELYSGKYRVDLKLRDQMNETQASFRKLNVS